MRALGPKIVAGHKNSRHWLATEKCARESGALLAIGAAGGVGALDRFAAELNRRA